MADRIELVLRRSRTCAARREDRSADRPRRARRHDRSCRPWGSVRLLDSGAGHTTIDGIGYVVADLSPYEADLDWSEITEPDEIGPVVADLGRATAKIHWISDSDSDEGLVEFSTEEAIATVLDGEQDAFVDDVVDFGIEYALRVRRDHELFVDAFRGGHFELVSAT